MFRFALILLLFSLAGVAQAERRVALVFGAEKYQNLRTLKNPLNDALGVEDALSGLGFEVYLESNRDLRRMRRALEDFVEDGAGADVALIYFAGHGMEIEQRNYLIPVDAGLSSVQELRDSALPLEEVNAALRAVAPVGLVLVDACRTDPFQMGDGAGRGAFTMNAPEAGLRPGLGRMGRADNLLFAFAAAPGQAALDGSGDHSPFTEALLRHLPTTGLEIRSVLTLVQQDVYDRTRGAQLPYVESGLPALVFAAGTGDLPEREQLLLAMAEVTEDDRAAVQAMATRHDVPLAPLFGALLSANLGGAAPKDRDRDLELAAQAFARVRADLQTLSSNDPAVAALRDRARADLALGAFDTARAALSEAAEIDRASRDVLRDSYLSRTLSEAKTHYLNGGAAVADLRRDLAIRDYRAAIALFEEARRIDPKQPIPLSYLYASDDLPGLLMTLGDTGGALQAMAADKALIRSHPEFDQDDAYWRRELIHRVYDFATILKIQGQAGEAERAFHEALELTHAQLQVTPDWPQMQGDHALILSALGDLAVVTGDWPGADAYYRDSLHIRQQLRRGEPNDPVLILTEARLLSSLGHLAHTRQDLETAWAAFADGAALRERLVAGSPQNDEYRLELAQTWVNMGGVAVDQGRFDLARSWVQAGYDQLVEMAARDPGHAVVQATMSEALGYLGLVATMQGDLEQARRHVTRATEITRDLAARDPENLDLTLEVSASYDMLGVLAMRAGDALGARAAFVQSRDIRAQLVRQEPGRADWKWTLLTSHYLIALVSPDPQPALRDVAAMLSDPQVRARFEASAAQNDQMVVWLLNGLNRLANGD